MNSEDFDIDAGVADIADSMGFTSEEAEIEEDLETEEPEEKEVETEEPKEKESEEVKPEVEAKTAPASWSKEQHENWAKIPKEAQDYIELREKQMLDGFEQYKQSARYAQDVSKALEPFREDLKDTGLTEPQIIYNLMTHHQALTKGTLEQRQAAFLEIGIQTGLIPKEGQQLPDENQRQIQERLARIEAKEREIQQRYQDEEMQRIQKEVDAFASDPAHAYFEELADDIAILLRTGLDLQSAYDRAVWSNPVTRAKEMEKTTSSLLEKSKKEAEMAKKATSANVKSKTTSRRDSTPVGSWDDTMQSVIKQLRN